MSGPRRRGARRALAVLLALVLVAAAGEVVARVHVARSMDPELLRVYTHLTDVKGRYRSHPRLPYVPTPGYPSHESHGFRGREVEVPKPSGRLRVACLGASTTYGHDLPWTDAWPARLEELLRAEGLDVDVVNAGVPGWVSRETLIGLRERVLPVQPDLVVVYQGRNELFPQSYRGYRPDYLHYRDPRWDFAATNRLHKQVFAVSRLALLLCTWRGQRFGWEQRLENPVYGCNLKENVPTPEEIVRFLADPARTEGYRANVRELVEVARGAGVGVLLCTMAFRSELFATGNLPEDPSTYPSLAAQVEENNAVVRAAAAELGVAVAETARMALEREWFRDDCHMTPAGHRRRAELVLEAIRTAGLLPLGR